LRSLWDWFSRLPLWVRVVATVVMISVVGYGAMYGAVNALHTKPSPAPFVSVTSAHQYEAGTPGDAAFSYVQTRAEVFGQTDAIREFYAYVDDGPVSGTTACFRIRVTIGPDQPETFYEVEVRGSPQPAVYGVSHKTMGGWSGVGTRSAQACLDLEARPTPSPTA
jgi:hypothetical protein